MLTLYHLVNMVCSVIVGWAVIDNSVDAYRKKQFLKCAMFSFATVFVFIAYLLRIGP